MDVEYCCDSWWVGVTWGEVVVVVGVGEKKLFGKVRLVIARQFYRAEVRGRIEEG